MKQLNNNGSVLIGTVTLAALLLITTAGFLLVVTNKSIDEAQHFENDLAFFAAESGLLLGARWLRTQNPFPDEGQTFTPFTGLQINNSYVDVTITTFSQGNTLSAKIIAETFNHATARSAGTFEKRLSYNSVCQLTFGEYATFFDDTYNGHGNWGGFYRRSFDGRFHMNTWIEISSYSEPGSENEVLFKDGLVTVADDYNGNYGDGSHHFNNYDYGLQLNFNGDADDCDLIFTDQYIANVDKIALPEGLTSGDFQSLPHIDLPTSTDEGTAYSHYRPTLEFKIADGTPEAIYHYKDGGGLKDLTISDYDGQILICPQNLNVLGTVQGKVTVGTATGKSIVPVGDIIYSDYDVVNKVIPQNSQNILGLVSGDYIKFNHKWKKEWGGVHQYENITGTLDITASVIAVEEVDGIKSCEYWDLNQQCNYNFVLNGNHILKAWRYVTSTRNGSPYRGCMGYIDYLHDRRLIRDIQPPGFPRVRTQSGLLMLSLNSWTEENEY